MHRLANYFLAKRCPLLFLRFTEPSNLFSSLPFYLELRNELRLRELETPWRESQEWGGSMRDPSPIPIPFPADGLSFLPRRRSTLKVIFRRPENVKPSAVSKRSRGGAERVSPSFLVTRRCLFFFSPSSLPAVFCALPPARDLHLALYEPGLPDEKGSVIFFSSNPWVRLIASSNFGGNPRANDYSLWNPKPRIDCRYLDCLLSLKHFFLTFYKSKICL